MGNKIINNLKLGLVGIVLAGGLNGYSQANKELDSLFNELYKSSKRIDSLSKEFSKSLENFEEEYNKSMADFREKNSEYYSKKIYSDTLKINLNEKIFYVTKKNEADGIKNIQKISRGYEEAWIYLPEKQIWYEYGIYSDSNSTTPFSPRIEEALKENPDIRELIFYHNHPSKNSDWPSVRDQLTLIKQNFDFSKYKITGKILTQEGVIEYSLNSKGKELIERLKIKNEDFIDINLLPSDEELLNYLDVKCPE